MSDKIKEIESRIATVNDPKEKVDLLNDLSWELKLSDPQRGLELSGKANQLSQELDYAAGLARSFCYMGTNYYYLSEFAKSMAVFEKALLIYEGIDDKNGLAITMNGMGITCVSTSDYPRALQYFLKSLKLRKELKSLKGEANTLNNIGNIYFELGDYEACLEYYVQSLNAYEILEDKFGISAALSNISIVHQFMGDYKNALAMGLKSYNIKRAIGDRHGEMISRLNSGDVHYKRNEYDQALEHYNEGVRISEELGEYLIRVGLLQGIGAVYQKMGKYDDAYQYLVKGLIMSQEVGGKYMEHGLLVKLGIVCGQKGTDEKEFEYLCQSLTIAEELHSKPKLAESHQALAGLFQRREDFRKALEHFQKYHEIDKDLFNESSDKKRQASMIKFQVEQKEKEAEIYRLRNVELAEANQAITQAKEIIEEKNRHITSSIEYARRIQQAVLPPAGKMQAALPEHFVLFRPRDIVSGDFYWFSQTGGKILIAVVDCTGHGVPGAFMSMIGSMLLNTIVNENGETSPAKILAQLHVAVRSALKQHDAEADTTDGMDVCLCVIEQGSKQLVYAGAKRPLYLVRNTELTEIAGDGKSIGGRQKEEKRAFSDKQLALQKGDMIYLTSDGYSDQCNPEGRKIGSRRLKELLIQVSGESHAGQRAALLAELEAHQNSEEQRDDIAIVGIRI